MPQLASAAGGFSRSSVFTNPFQALSFPSQSLGTIAAGDYGDNAKVLLMVAGLTGNPTVSPAQTLTVTFSGGAVTETTLPDTIDGNIPSPSLLGGGNKANYAMFARVYEPVGWSFNSGSTITMSIAKGCAYTLTGTVSGTLGGNTVTGSGTAFLSELVAGQEIWSPGIDGGVFLADFIAQIASVDSNTLAHTSSPTNFNFSNVTTTTSLAEDIFYSWILIGKGTSAQNGFSGPADLLAGHGFTTVALGVPAPLYANGTGPTFGVTSFTGNFGDYDGSGGVRIEEYIQSGATKEAFAVLMGVGANGVSYTPNLVNGVSGWIPGNSAGTVGYFNGSAHWVRSTIPGAPISMLMTWTSFPSAPWGQGFVVIFPSGTAGTSGNRAYVMG